MKTLARLSSRLLQRLASRPSLTAGTTGGTQRVYSIAVPCTHAITGRRGRSPNMARRGMHPWNSTAASCREPSHTIEMIAMKTDQFAEKVLDAAEQLATLGGLTQLVLVCGMIRTQAWLQLRTSAGARAVASIPNRLRGNPEWTSRTVSQIPHAGAGERVG
jgi:hypothetical protein